jgi:hypothetical protein
VDGPGPHLLRGERIRARSRTFLPAALGDNPDLAETGYAAVLAGLPEELRRAYRDGDFATGLRDHEYQVIPTAWIEAAQKRWSATPPRHAMTAIGVDVAQGGPDQTVLAARHGGWYAPLARKPGAACRQGGDVAALVVQVRGITARSWSISAAAGAPRRSARWSAMVSRSHPIGDWPRASRPVARGD